MHLMTLISLCAVLAGPPHGLPTPEEEKLFADGLRALSDGDARGAEASWQKGYAVRHDPAFLVRIGEAQEKAGARPAAAESYRRYLREAPDAADKGEIEQRIARLTTAAAPATPATPAVPPDAAGKQPTAPETAALSPPPAAAPTPPARPAVAAAVDPETTRPARDADDQPAGWTPANTTAWIAVGATAVLLGTAAFFAASAASHKDDVNRLITYREPATGQPLAYKDVAARYESATADGRHDDRVAKIALLAAAGTAAVATTFFLLDARRGGDGSLAVSPDGRGLAVAGTWRWRF